MTIPPPRGLPNPGSLCYLNALIQCIASVDSFIEFIWDPQQSNHDDAVISAFSSVIVHADDANNKSYQNLVRSLATQFQRHMNIFEQNDITEMYSLLLDHVARMCGKELSSANLTEINNVLNAYPGTQYYALKKTIDRHWYMHHKKGYSNLCDIACGQHIAQVQCQHCHALHHNIEVFSTLDIHIPSSPIRAEVSLQDLLLEYFRDETLTDWMCDKCHTKCNTNVRSLRSWRNPKMLVITIKRFTAEGEKIHTKIHTPRAFDMTPVTLCKETNLEYNLKAVACHHGSFFGGHYVSIVCRDGTWYVADDEVVRPCSDEDAQRFTKDGYMFVYEAIP